MLHQVPTERTERSAFRLTTWCWLARCEQSLDGAALLCCLALDLARQGFGLGGDVGLGGQRAEVLVDRCAASVLRYSSIAVRIVSVTDRPLSFDKIVRRACESSSRRMASVFIRFVLLPEVLVLGPE